MRDVAAAAGVSVATASRVLGGSSRSVAPEYEERVLAAASALRYTADAAARAMRRVSDSIALVADDLTTPSIGLLVAAMEQEARSSGAFVTVSPTGGTPERQLETIRRLRALRPRALVLTTGRVEAAALGGRLTAELLAYQRDGGRVVIVGDTDTDFDSIRFDNRGSAREMGVYVGATGHRRVAVLAGPAGQAAMTARVEGFVSGLEDTGAGHEQVRIVYSELTRQGGFDAVRELISGARGGVDAVVAANDLLAIGGLGALRAEGISVPRQLSVTGFDDIQLAVDVTPRLTTIGVPLAEAGAEAIRLAVSARSDRVHLVLRGRLIVRDSTVARTSDGSITRL
nr:LacI family DNA-binding transcriptional regulator [Phytoactinopolyspora mesophila]